MAEDNGVPSAKNLRNRETGPRNHRPSRSPTIVTIGSASLLVAGFTFSLLARADESQRGATIFQVGGIALAICSSTALLLVLMSYVGSGCAKALAARRPSALVLRSGGTPELKALFDEQPALRRRFALKRPVTLYFVLLIDTGGIELWHGPSSGQMIGALSSEDVIGFETGWTVEGAKRLAALMVNVEIDQHQHQYALPFVVRKLAGLRGVGPDELIRLVEVARSEIPSHPRGERS